MNADNLNKLWSKLYTPQVSEIVEELRLKTDLTESAQVLRGLARYYTRDNRGALQDFQAVRKVNPENIIARSYMALIYARTERYQECWEHLSPKPFFPNHRFLFDFLVVFWPLQFKVDELSNYGVEKDEVKDPFASEYESSSKPNKSLARKYRKHAQKVVQKNQYGLYALCSERAAELDPDHELALELRTHSLLMRNDYQAAFELLADVVEKKLQSYRESRKVDELPDTYLLVQWAVILHGLKDFEGSLAILSNLTPDGPYDYGMHYIAGLNWIMIDDKAKAWECSKVAFQDFYFESWPMYMEAFRNEVFKWLEGKAKEASAA